MEPLIKGILMGDHVTMDYDKNNCFEFGEGIWRKRAKITYLSPKLFTIISPLWDQSGLREMREMG